MQSIDPINTPLTNSVPPRSPSTLDGVPVDYRTARRHHRILATVQNQFAALLLHLLVVYFLKKNDFSSKKIKNRFLSRGLQAT